MYPLLLHLSHEVHHCLCFLKFVVCCVPRPLHCPGGRVTERNWSNFFGWLRKNRLVLASISVRLDTRNRRDVCHRGYGLDSDKQQCI